MSNDLQALSDAATPGPWIRKWQSLDVHAMSGDGVFERQENIDFAVAAVAHVRDELAATPVVPAEGLREAIKHIRGLASGDGGDEASRNDPHNALTTIVIVCDEALTASPSPDTDAGLDVERLARAVDAAIENIAHGRVGAAVAGLRAARDADARAHPERYEWSKPHLPPRFREPHPIATAQEPG